MRYESQLEQEDGIRRPFQRSWPEGLESEDVLDLEPLSTEQTFYEAPPGSKWAVGTEINLVSRLARENPDKLVFCLDPVVCPCATMFRIHPAYLAWALDELAAGRIVNQVIVDEETAKYARVALERMLSVR